MYKGGDVLHLTITFLNDTKYHGTSKVNNSHGSSNVCETNMMNYDNRCYRFVPFQQQAHQWSTIIQSENNSIFIIYGS